MRSPGGGAHVLKQRWSFFQKSLEIRGLYGRVAQLGEHLLCKHAFNSPKSLNRRFLSVQNPLLVGLLNGLQMIKDYVVQVWTNTLINGTRFVSSERYRKNDPGLLSAIGETTRSVIQNLKTRRPGNSRELPGCFPFPLYLSP